MSVGYSAKLPMKESGAGSIYGLNESLRDTVRQNVKMLVLTAPGERIMDTNFGVGLRRYFFRPMTNRTFDTIATSIREQMTHYMPFLKFDGVKFQTKEQDQALDWNQVRIKIFYTIPSIGETDSIAFIELTSTS